MDKDNDFEGLSKEEMIEYVDEQYPSRRFEDAKVYEPADQAYERVMEAYREMVSSYIGKSHVADALWLLHGQGFDIYQDRPIFGNVIRNIGYHLSGAAQQGIRVAEPYIKLVKPPSAWGEQMEFYYEHCDLIKPHIQRWDDWVARARPADYHSFQENAKSWHVKFLEKTDLKRIIADQQTQLPEMFANCATVGYCAAVLPTRSGAMSDLYDELMGLLPPGQRAQGRVSRTLVVNASETQKEADA